MMKNILIVVLALGLLAACGKQSVQKEKIFKLSQEWDVAKSKASGIGGTLGNALALLASSNSSLDSLVAALPDPDIIPEDLNKKLAELRPRLDGANRDIIALVQETSKASIPLENNLDEVKELEKKAQFDEPMQPDYKKRVAELEQTLSNSNAQLNGMKDRIDKVVNDVNSLYDEVRAMVAAGQN